MTNFLKRILDAIQHCKRWIITIFILYCVSCLVGIIMVHSGNLFALSQRDRIVGKANAHDKASINYINGNKVKAALIDFSGNLFLGSVPQTVAGLSVVIPFMSVTYQGWVGGIVSVDGQHASRLDKSKTAMYYLIVLILQFIPYSLAIGSGVKLGVDTYHLNKGKSLLQFKFSRPALKDILFIYLLVIPLFFLASCFEFLSGWNF
jgi:hypothetical protein